MSSPTLFDDFFQENEPKKSSLSQKREKAKLELKKQAEQNNAETKTGLFALLNEEESQEKIEKPIPKRNIFLELPEVEGATITASSEIGLPTTTNDNIKTNLSLPEKTKEELELQYQLEVPYFDRISSNESENNTTLESVDNEDTEAISKHENFAQESQHNEPSDVESTNETENTTNPSLLINESIDENDEDISIDNTTDNEAEIEDSEEELNNIFDLHDQMQQDLTTQNSEKIEDEIIDDDNVEIESINTYENINDTASPELNLEDKYYAIGAVAELIGVNISNIRFWANEFKMKVRTTRKGTRLFNKKQVEELRLIHFLVKHQKYTLKGAKEQLKRKPKAVESNVNLSGKLEHLKNQLLQIKEKLDNEYS